MNISRPGALGLALIAWAIILLGVQLVHCLGCKVEAPPQPPGALTCIDRCLPDGVHLDRACYERCTEHSP